MEVIVVADVEFRVESDRTAGDYAAADLHIYLLGAVRVNRNGRPVELPPSRKLRALLAYLALAPQALLRERLCEIIVGHPE